MPREDADFLSYQQRRWEPVSYTHLDVYKRQEQANFFGLFIAYDPYKRELVDGKTLTTCGGDGGCNICGGMGPLLGYLPCSPHCKPEVREDNEIHNDYDFFRPVIRVQTSGWKMVSSKNER